MVALSIIAGLVLLGIAFGVFEFDGLLDDWFSGGDSHEEDDVDTVEGSSGDDLLSTGNDDDDVYGYDGNDTIDAEGGEDLVFGGEGRDEIDGGLGNDTIFGEDGSDTISADGGVDVVFAGAGADDVDGGWGADTILGETGNDSLHGRVGDDFIIGGEGADTIKGGAGQDFLHGVVDSQFDDEFDESDIYDPDSILGGDGEDLIVAGSGDTINGGDGIDALMLGSWIDPSNPVHVEEFERSEDFLIVMVADNYAGARVVTITPDPGATDMATLYLDGVRLAEIEGTSSLSGFTVDPLLVGTSAELEERLASLQNDS